MTVADAFGRLRLSTLVAVVGFAVVAVGSIGPWGTVGALSVSGTKGDGVITLVCAAVGVLALALGRGRTVAAIIAGVAAVVALVTAGYDTVHIAYEASQITLFGVQLVHAGWGVYVVVIGAAIACGALAMRLSAALLRNAAIVLAVAGAAGVFVAAGVLGNRNAHSSTPSAAYQSTTTSTNSTPVAKTATVTSIPSTTAAATTTTASTTAAPSTPTEPAPGSSSGGLRPCDENVSANSDTSCDFASNTFYEYWQATGGDLSPGQRSVEVWSPTTQQSYTQICTNDGKEVDCTHNNGDEVRFSAASIMAYTGAEAHTYAASGKLGP